MIRKATRAIGGCKVLYSAAAVVPDRDKPGRKLQVHTNQGRGSGIGVRYESGAESEDYQRNELRYMELTGGHWY